MTGNLLVTALGALLAAGIVAVPTAWLNDLGVMDAMVLVGWFWLLWLVPLAAMHALLSIVGRTAGRPLTPSQRAGVMWAAPVGLYWIVRLEPAHQWISFRPHLSMAAVLELGLLAAGTSVLVAAAVGGRPRQRAVHVVAATVMVCAVLQATAVLVEPRRSRDTELRRATADIAQRPRTGDQPAGVLVLAIDGLDWRSVNWLAERGRIPTIAGLVARGSSYRLDNRAMLNSPPIWTAVYTGAPQRTNQVGGFEEWHFAGVSRPIVFLPTAGAHSWFMIDQVLSGVDLFGAWRTVASSTVRILQPPIWTIASASGLKVGVFNPVPFFVIGERVNGFFALSSLDGMRIHRLDGAEFSGPLPGGEFEHHAAEAAVAAQAFRADRPDLGVYYTHFVDSVAHSNWDFRFRQGFFGGDPAGRLDERFTHSPVADAYAHVDAGIRQIIEAFGDPAVVVLVSDHGWEYNDYEHFLRPDGMLVVSGTGAAGVGGRADVLSVAPSRGSTTRFDALRPDFILDRVIDPDRRQLLRSLGYIR